MPMPGETVAGRAAARLRGNDVGLALPGERRPPQGAPERTVPRSPFLATHRKRERPRSALLSGEGAGEVGRATRWRWQGQQWHPLQLAMVKGRVETTKEE